MTGPVGELMKGIEDLAKRVCERLAGSGAGVLELTAKILDSLSSGERPPSPSTVYSRLIITLGPLGWLVANALSKPPGAAAALLDAFEDACIEKGAEAGVMLKLRDLIARYYDKLHPVMEEIPPILASFHVYPDKNLDAIQIDLQFDNGDHVRLVATRGSAEQLAAAIKWALEALGTSGGHGLDGEAEHEMPQVIKLDDLQAAISAVFGEGESPDAGGQW